MRLLLIFNASASSVTARGRVVIQKALSADHEVTAAETNRRGHATRLAQGAAAQGLDAVVCLGGDGTLNEIANGLAGSSTALGVLPGGSTNVFARTIGVTNDPIEATGQLLSSMAAGSMRRIGLGSINGRYFLFHVGLGFDAAVVEQVERRSELKRWAGHPLFVYAGFATWFRHFDRNRPYIRIRYDDGEEIDSPFAIFLNTNPYTYLGNRPLNVAPRAGLERPLSVVAFKHMRLLPVIRVIAGALGYGALPERHRIVHARDEVRHVVVDGHGPFPYQVDGDHLGDIDRVELAWEPDLLHLFVPPER